MYSYTFKILPSRQKSQITFTAHEAQLKEAVMNVNSGTAFRRDGKTLALSEMTAVLTSREPLPHPARSLSALTRYLTLQYSETFEPYIFNKTLFTITRSQETAPSRREPLSNEELLKAMVDFLYATPQTERVQAARAEIEKVLEPFIEKGEKE